MNRLGQMLPLILLPSWIFALPSEPSVASGFAAFDSQGKSLIIQSADKTIINWQNFSIGDGELASFVLPDSNGSVLNRVIGADVSSLFGTLASNGQVFLINPNGVLVGPNGCIDTASFVAATLDLSDENFLAGGALLFQGDSQASIINLGTIHAWDGDALLIGYHIDNQGEINVPNGLSGIAAGKEVVIKPSGDERIFVCANVPVGARSENGIDHSGVIQAISTELKADGNLYSLAINYTGKAEMTGAEMRDGKVFLVANKGYIEFQGKAYARNADGTGGEVRILGETIHLADTAMIDVSGDFGGGTALIGGNYHGKETPGPTAQMTYIEKNAQVLADAHISGDGGLAVFWSDKDIAYFGNASVSGGEESGNGGTVEVSSKGPGYIFNGSVCTNAPQGKAGLLLLDPTDIFIESFGSSPGFAAPITTGTNTPNSCNPPHPIADIGQITSALMLGDVTIATNNVLSCPPQTGTITLNGAMVRSDTNTLTLDAANAININPNTGITGSGSLALTAGGGITINSSIITSLGDITMTLSGGDIVITPVTASVEVSSTNQVTNGISINYIGPGSGSLFVEAGAFSAQLGSTAPIVNCDISLTSITDTFATSVVVSGGSSPNAYAQIGHNGGTSIAGAITIINNNADIDVTAGTAVNTYAQIGHAPNTSSPTAISGSVQVAFLPAAQTNNINVTGGSAMGAYALIGIGGQVTPLLTLTNLVGISAVDVECIESMTLTGGTDVDTYAAIGVTGGSNVTFTSPGVAGAAYKIFVMGDEFIAVQSGMGPFTSGAYLGYFFYDGTPGTITVPPSPNDFLRALIYTDGDLSFTSQAGFPSTAAIGIDAQSGTIGDIGIDLLFFSTSTEFTDAGSSNPTGGAFAQDGIGNPLNHSTSTATTIFVGGPLSITSSTTSSAYINATGPVDIFMYGDMTLTGNTFPAYMNAPNGSVTCLDLVLQTNAYINIPETGGGLLTLSSFFNTSITNNSYIQSLSPTGSITIDIDAFTSFPTIGTQTFVLDSPDSFISLVAGNQLRIYTDQFSLNNIQGTLNGVLFTGIEFVNDNQNQYSVFYPGGGFFPFFPYYRVYYREPGIVPPTPPFPPFIVVGVQVVTFQGIPDLQLYDQMEVWSNDFTIGYDDASFSVAENPERVFPWNSLSSQQVIDIERYFERIKKHLMNQDPL